MAQEKIVQTAGRNQLGEFAPKFAELNDDVLFGEVWSRTDKLGLRDRSLVTIASLISQGITDNSLVFHLQSAKKNGITRTEIAEIITHIGFYAGWPKAWAAFNLAKDVWAEDSTGNDAKASRIRPMRGILLVIATSPRFLVNKLRFPMLRLNRVVAITGISIVQRKVVGKCLSVLPDGGGIKKRVRLPWRFCPVPSSIFLRT